MNLFENNREEALRLILECRRRDKAEEKKSLRIDDNTMILVPPGKCTPEYAGLYRHRVSLKIPVDMPVTRVESLNDE